jgi:hypothetical protein
MTAGTVRPRQPAEAIETWLREKVVPAACALKADPSRARSIEQVRERLAEKRAAGLPKGGSR